MEGYEIQVTGATLVNFRNFGITKAFTCEFLENQIFRGGNGSGKSTLGPTGLQACVNGIKNNASGGALVDDRLQFIGTSGATAKIEYRFVDKKTGSKFSVKNVISKTGNSIVFTPEKGCTLDKGIVPQLINSNIISANAFVLSGPKQQALTLGIVTAPFDAAIKIAEEARRDCNRDVKSIVPVECEEAYPVDVANISERKKLAKKTIDDELNRRVIKNAELRKGWDKKVEEAIVAANNSNAKEMEYRAEYDAIGAGVEVVCDNSYPNSEHLMEWYRGLKMPVEDVAPVNVPEPVYLDLVVDASGIDALDQELENAAAMNVKAQAYAKNLSDAALLKTATVKAEEAEKEVVAARKERDDYIKGFDFGFQGLTVNDDCELIYNGRYISSYSTGERELIMARLHISMPGNILKTRFVDEWNSIDDENQKKILKILTDAGFQYFLGIPNENFDDPGAIVLRECQQVTGPESTEPIQETLL